MKVELQNVLGSIYEAQPVVFINLTFISNSIIAKA